MGEAESYWKDCNPMRDKRAILGIAGLFGLGNTNAFFSTYPQAEPHTSPIGREEMVRGLAKPWYGPTPSRLMTHIRVVDGVQNAIGAGLER
jgi:hypothetical protein